MASPGCGWKAATATAANPLVKGARTHAAVIRTGSGNGWSRRVDSHRISHGRVAHAARRQPPASPVGPRLHRSAHTAPTGPAATATVPKRRSQAGQAGQPGEPLGMTRPRTSAAGRLDGHEHGRGDQNGAVERASRPAPTTTASGARPPPRAATRQKGLGRRGGPDDRPKPVRRDDHPPYAAAVRLEMWRYLTKPPKASGAAHQYTINGSGGRAAEPGPPRRVRGNSARRRPEGGRARRRARFPAPPAFPIPASTEASGKVIPTPIAPRSTTAPGLYVRQSGRVISCASCVDSHRRLNS